MKRHTIKLILLFIAIAVIFMIVFRENRKKIINKLENHFKDRYGNEFVVEYKGWGIGGYIMPEKITYFTVYPKDDKSLTFNVNYCNERDNLDSHAYEYPEIYYKKEFKQYLEQYLESVDIDAFVTGTGIESSINRESSITHNDSMPKLETLIKTGILSQGLGAGIAIFVPNTYSEKDSAEKVLQIVKQLQNIGITKMNLTCYVFPITNKDIVLNELKRSAKLRENQELELSLAKGTEEGNRAMGNLNSASQENTKRYVRYKKNNIAQLDIYIVGNKFKDIKTIDDILNNTEEKYLKDINWYDYYSK